MNRKIFFLILYKFFARHLPYSGAKIIGKLSKKFRAYCCKQIFKKCGVNVNIEKGANFAKGFDIEIGDNSGIGIYCTVPDDIVIGNDVLMGPRCYILEGNHITDRVDIPMRGRGIILKKTIIEDDVWIGRQCIFTPGRTVKKGTIIAAGTVLCKDFPAYSVVGGNPSKFIKSRLDVNN
ncbi:MAG: acyltransferase [Bacteroidia bacterium]